MAMLTPAMFAEVVIYRTPFCPYCVRAAMLLKGKGVAFREIDVSNDPDARERLLSETGSHTVPQIFINGASVGGYDDIAALDRRGALDPLLREAPVR
jgi:glutaredoxin 3